MGPVAVGGLCVGVVLTSWSGVGCVISTRLSWTQEHSRWAASQHSDLLSGGRVETS